MRIEHPRTMPDPIQVLELRSVFVRHRASYQEDHVIQSVLLEQLENFLRIFHVSTG